LAEKAGHEGHRNSQGDKNDHSWSIGLFLSYFWSSLFAVSGKQNKGDQENERRWFIGIEENRM
jgi:hypothetical protein